MTGRLASGRLAPAVTGIVGTGISGAFPYLIAATDVTGVFASFKPLRGLRSGSLDEVELENGKFGRIGQRWQPGTRSA